MKNVRKNREKFEALKTLMEGQQPSMHRDQIQNLIQTLTSSKLTKNESKNLTQNLLSSPERYQQFKSLIEKRLESGRSDESEELEDLISTLVRGTSPSAEESSKNRILLFIQQNLKLCIGVVLLLLAVIIVSAVCGSGKCQATESNSSNSDSSSSSDSQTDVSKTKTQII
jgi:hypothetical protein